MAEIAIRPARREDVALILRCIRATAVYEREPDAVVATEETLLAHGFGPNPYFHCLIAEFEGAPAGFAFYFFDYSTWLGAPGRDLEDLFVDPAFRQRGIGKALLQKVAGVAVVEGCPRLEWNVLDWNKNAVDFYDEMGAQMSTDWRIMRITGPQLGALSERCD